MTHIPLPSRELKWQCKNISFAATQSHPAQRFHYSTCWTGSGNLMRGIQLWCILYFNSISSEAFCFDTWTSNHSLTLPFPTLSTSFKKKCSIYIKAVALYRYMALEIFMWRDWLFLSEKPYCINTVNVLASSDLCKTGTVGWSFSFFRPVTQALK